MSFNKKFLWYSIAVVAVGTAGFVAFKNGNHKENTLVARPGDFVQQISVSGKVVAAENLDLSFEQSGRITSIRIKTGDNVAAGSVLASQDTAELDAQLAETNAAIDVQKAKLSQLLAGASPEDIQVSETAVLNAEDAVRDASVAFLDATQNLVETLQDAYTKADDAVRGKADQLFSNPRSGNPQLSLHDTVDSKLEADIEWGRLMLEKDVFNTWPTLLAAVSIDTDLSVSAALAKQNLEAVRQFLDNVSLAVSSITANSNLTQSTIDGWKSDIGTARTNVNTAIGNITTAQTNVKTKMASVTAAKGSVKTAENKLALAKAPTRSSDIALYEAQIRQAEASAQNIIAQTNKRRLYAPIAGLVSAVDSKAKMGSAVSANQLVVTLISANTLQIESFIPEIHTPFIEVGDEAVVTLDAYGSEVPFAAKVIAVDPAETIRDGVSTYKTTLQFIERDERIKSGMTASVLITTEKKTNTISVPQGIISTREGKKYVNVREGDAIVPRLIEIGVVSSLGEAEVVSGLNEGDVVIIEPPGAE